VIATHHDAIARRFAANLRRIRRQADLSQEGLGFGASLHRTEIGYLERGHRLPRIDTLVKLAGALEVSADELLEGIAWVPGSHPAGEFRTHASPRERIGGE
jgi:transcriptional regulator with XRE-family HTH domain